MHILTTPITLNVLCKVAPFLKSYNKRTKCSEHIHTFSLVISQQLNLWKFLQLQSICSYQLGIQNYITQHQQQHIQYSIWA